MDTKAGKIGNEHKAKVVRAVLLGLLLLAIAFLLVAQFAAPSKVIIGDATAALTLIGGAAVVIERILEGFWTFVGLMGANKWPLGPLSDQFKNMTKDLDATLAPYQQEAEAALQRLSVAQNWAPQQLATALSELKQIET